MALAIYPQMAQQLYLSQVPGAGAHLHVICLAKNVCVVLLEAANSRQPGECPAELISVKHACDTHVRSSSVCSLREAADWGKPSQRPSYSFLLNTLSAHVRVELVCRTS